MRGGEGRRTAARSSVVTSDSSVPEVRDASQELGGSGFRLGSFAPPPLAPHR